MFVNLQLSLENKILEQKVCNHIHVSCDELMHHTLILYYSFYFTWIQNSQYI